MSPQLVIRSFRADEWPLYRDLRLRALVDSPDAFGRTHAEEKDRPDVEWSRRLSEWTISPVCLALVAFLGERPVGLAFARIETEALDVSHLYSMWVDPSARKIGVGRQLVESLVNWSRQRNARKMALQVTESNNEAVKLYERFGFVPTGEVVPLREGSQLLARTMELAL
jgi:ribosomal protein S18 acetylase RimI-like enzyme